MRDAGFQRFARGLGRATGRLMERAREAGLDKKAEDLAEKAQAAVKRWLAKAEEEPTPKPEEPTPEPAEKPLSEPADKPPE